MKYTVEIDINIPRKKVIEYFDSTDNMYKWQEGLIEHEFIEGKQGEVGSKMRLKYDMGKRKIDMIETITLKDLPDRFDGTYDAPGVHNIIQNEFIELGPNKTKWVTHQEFQMSGFMMKVIGFLLPSQFKKQSMKYLEDFKKFAEAE